MRKSKQEHSFEAPYVTLGEMTRDLTIAMLRAVDIIFIPTSMAREVFRREGIGEIEHQEWSYKLAYLGESVRTCVYAGLASQLL